MAKNYLLIYSEKLATAIELLCQNIKAPSNTLFKSAKVQVVCTQIYARLITGRVKRICFQNLKSRSKNVAKPKVGYSCYSTQTALMKKPIRIIEIFAVVSEEC